MTERQAISGDDLTGPKIPLPRLVRIFEVHNLTEGKTASTVKWYNDVLALFIRWLEEEGRSNSLCDITEMDVREYILHLQSRPGVRGKTSSHTVSNRVRAIRAFFAWVARAGFAEEHLFKTGVKGSVYSSSVYANARMHFAETILAANIALIV